MNSQAELTVPQLGESITEAIVSKWHKQVGENVQQDEPVVVLETDKVTVDVPAPASGVLASVARPEGEKVRIGDLLGAISLNGKAVAAAPATSPAPARAAAAPAAAVESSGERSVPVTPVAKRVIEEKQLDASKIRGSGPGGKVLKDDVLSHVGGPPPVTEGVPAKASAATATVVQLPSAARPTGEREERVRMTPLRKRVAERLLAAQSNAAILTTFNECDMGEVMALRKRHGEAFQTKHGVKLGFMSFFVRAAVEALKEFPAVNAEIDGEDVVFKRYYDIGVAVSGSRGLVVPVLRDADKLSMAELEKRIGDFAVKARSDKLGLADLQGGTFTITNGGIFGSMLSTPIINPPQTGILGMHNIVERPVVRDGQVVVRPIMYLALSYDHRLIDGREAVRFLVRIKECIESPERLLLEV